ncbi:MAG: hypothetical protein QHH24_07240 [Candidatus Bathyarchaeota archaeon]|jgi:hypothetical protein|nr:hypothetical protein [Candidatus Bathyarchaeota archaeon]
MQTTVKNLAAITLLLVFLLLATVDVSVPYKASRGINREASSSQPEDTFNGTQIKQQISAFLQNPDDWLRHGYKTYAEPSTSMVTAEVTVGEGEKYESIQEAFDAGYTCLFLKKQKFNVTSPIIPSKEDFYILGNGAEITATKTISTILDIRSLRYAHLDGLVFNGSGLAQKCIDASHPRGQVPVHQVRNCKIMGAVFEH